MKTINLIIIICSITFQGYSQYSLSYHVSSFLKTFSTTETLVPIIGIDSIDNKIKKTLEDNWTFTKLRFVPINELDEFDNAPNVSIINLLTIIWYVSGSDVNSGRGNTSLCFYIPANIQDTRMSNIIASIPIQCTFPFLDGFCTECKFEQINYKIDILLMQLIEVVNFASSETYEMAVVHDRLKQYTKKYNKKIIRDNKKTQIKPLLINEEFFNTKVDSVKFKKIYKNEIRIVNDFEYKKILNSNTKEFIVMLRGYVPSSMLSVFDLESHKTLYVGMHEGIINPFINPLRNLAYSCRLTKKQIKSLNKHIKRLAR